MQHRMFEAVLLFWNLFFMELLIFVTANIMFVKKVFQELASINIRHMSNSLILLLMVKFLITCAYLQYFMMCN